MNHFKDLIKQYVAEAIQELLEAEGSSIQALGVTQSNPRQYIGNKLLNRSNSPFNTNSPGQSPDLAVGKLEAEQARQKTGVSVVRPLNDTQMQQHFEKTRVNYNRFNSGIMPDTFPKASQQQRQGQQSLQSPIANAVKAKPVKIK